MPLNRTIKRERRRIDATERSLRRDRESDFRWASGSVDAIYAALGRTVRRSGRKLTAQNKRVLGAMQDLQRRQRAGGRRLAATERRVDDTYGLADTSGQFSVARAQQRGGQAVVDAQVAAGRQASRGTNDLVALARAGAREAEAGADQALAEALGARTEEDTALVAQQRHDLAMAKLQQQFAEQAQQKEFELWKKKLRFEQSLATKAAGPEVGGQLATMASNLSDVSSKARAILAEESGDITPAELIEQLVADDVLEPEEAKNPTYRSLITNLKNANAWGDQAGRDSEVDAILSALRDNYRSYYGDHRKVLTRLVTANLNALYNAPADPRVQDSGGLTDVMEEVLSLGGRPTKTFN